ncbi:MAG: C1 family peptidase [Oscillospiraceae bacterium]|nr:C1 family peptidase [Oscillospiraceae bacterium]
MEIMKNAVPVTFSDLETFENAYHSKRYYAAMTHSVSKTSVADAAFCPENAYRMRRVYFIDIPTLPVTNQKASGRCWLFAALNVMREIIAKKYNLEKFEISQNYIAFWDKFEKINYFLESVIDTANLPSDDRTVSWIVSTGIQDGGQWDMMVALVKKYGLVSKDAMPETFQSSNTGAMNAMINTKLRAYTAELRRMIRGGASAEDVNTEKNRILSEMYRILCICFGEPPKKFDFEYKNKDTLEYGIICDITPTEFYEKYIGGILDDYVSIINAPTEDKPFNKTYTVNYLGNVLEGAPILYLNLEMDELVSLVIKQLKDKEVVWFGSDVGKFGNRAEGIWDDLSYDYGSAFDIDYDISKADALDYRNSCMNHAMVITGVNLDENDKPNRWKIENSWGDQNGDEGYYMMSGTWFDRFVYQAVVHKKYLSEEQLKMLEEKPIRLNPWDPMGSLANCD